MKIIECEQGSEKWFAARLGIPSASNFNKIITSKGEASKSAAAYMDGLLAEWLAGKPLDGIEPTPWMIRGNELEAEARKAYQFIMGNAVECVGFCTLDDGSAGASPDGLVGDDGGLEIKCVKGATLIGYYRKGFPTGYKAQVQGALWITGREWWDFMAYHPDMRPYIERINRDDDFINALGSAVKEFNEKYSAEKKKLSEWKM